MKRKQYSDVSLFRATVAVILLNLFDANVTLALVEGRLAEEANPLMATAILDWGALGFMVTKLALVSLGMWVLWQRRRRPMAALGIACAATVYVGVCLYHVKSLSILAGSFV